MEALGVPALLLFMDASAVALSVLAIGAFLGNHIRANLNQLMFQRLVAHSHGQGHTVAAALDSSTLPRFQKRKVSR